MKDPYPSFFAHWWLLIPTAAGAMIRWAVFFGQARKLWAAMFG